MRVLETSNINLCCVKQHRAGRGQTEHGSHHWCSPERCTPCLRMVCGHREDKIQSASRCTSIFGSFFPTELPTCSSVCMCGLLQQFSLHLWCSVLSVLLPYTSPSPPSLFLHAHVLIQLQCHKMYFILRWTLNVKNIHTKVSSVIIKSELLPSHFVETQNRQNLFESKLKYYCISMLIIPNISSLDKKCHILNKYLKYNV